MLQNGYGVMQPQAFPAGYQGEWQDYQYSDQLAYSEQYLQLNMQAYDMQTGANIAQDPRLMTQEEKDRGLGSVFKRDDQRLQQLRERDAREKDPNFISESYSECYPGYQEYNREIVDSDDEDDLSKMDMGGRVFSYHHQDLSLKTHGSFKFEFDDVLIYEILSDFCLWYESKSV